MIAAEEELCDGCAAVTDKDCALNASRGQCAREMAVADRCIVCGGTMVGDGHTTVLHCENASYDDVYDKEPDASPVYCME